VRGGVDSKSAEFTKVTADQALDESAGHGVVVVCELPV
jgi:hypothetical protein